MAFGHVKTTPSLILVVFAGKRGGVGGGVPSGENEDERKT